MVRRTDRPAMTIAVDLGGKATKTNKQMWHLDTCVQKKIILKKKTADTNKTMKNYPTCKLPFAIME